MRGKIIHSDAVSLRRLTSLRSMIQLHSARLNPRVEARMVDLVDDEILKLEQCQKNLAEVRQRIDRLRTTRSAIRRRIITAAAPTD